MNHLLKYLRDYFQEIEAAISTKLATWQVQHLSLWSDYIEVPAAPVISCDGADDLTVMEDQAQALRFREVKAKMAQDIASMTAYNAKAQENCKRSHVVSVMHEKGQIQVGKELLRFNHQVVLYIYDCLLFIDLSLVLLF